MSSTPSRQTPAPFASNEKTQQNPNDSSQLATQDLSEVAKQATAEGAPSLNMGDVTRKTVAMQFNEQYGEVSDLSDTNESVTEEVGPGPGVMTAWNQSAAINESLNLTAARQSEAPDVPSESTIVQVDPRVDEDGESEVDIPISSKRKAKGIQKKKAKVESHPNFQYEGAILLDKFYWVARVGVDRCLACIQGGQKFCYVRADRMPIFELFCWMVYNNIQEQSSIRRPAGTTCFQCHRSHASYCIAKESLQILGIYYHHSLAFKGMQFPITTEPPGNTRYSSKSNTMSVRRKKGTRVALQHLLKNPPPSPTVSIENGKRVIKEFKPSYILNENDLPADAEYAFESSSDFEESEKEKVVLKVGPPRKKRKLEEPQTHPTAPDRLVRRAKSKAQALFPIEFSESSDSAESAIAVLHTRHPTSSQPIGKGKAKATPPPSFDAPEDRIPFSTTRPPSVPIASTSRLPPPPRNQDDTMQDIMLQLLQNSNDMLFMTKKHYFDMEIKMQQIQETIGSLRYLLKHTHEKGPVTEDEMEQEAEYEEKEQNDGQGN